MDNEGPDWQWSYITPNLGEVHTRTKITNERDIGYENMVKKDFKEFKVIT